MSVRGRGGRQMRAAALALVAVALFGAKPAQAVLVEVDLNTPGDGLVTRDTDTSLDWLDLTESTNLSFDQVEADVGGFISDGWRHATGAEVCALFAAADGEPSPCPGGITNPAGGFLLWLEFVNLLGPTQFCCNTLGAHGLYDDGDPSEPGGVGRARADLIFANPIAEVRDDQRTSDLAVPSQGHFLVRPSPVAMPIGPYVGPVLLLLLALTGLVMVRTRSA